MPVIQIFGLASVNQISVKHANHGDFGVEIHTHNVYIVLYRGDLTSKLGDVVIVAEL